MVTKCYESFDELSSVYKWVLSPSLEPKEITQNSSCRRGHDRIKTPRWEEGKIVPAVQTQYSILHYTIKRYAGEEEMPENEGSGCPPVPSFSVFFENFVMSNYYEDRVRM
jgi:hypothetical protein